MGRIRYTNLWVPEGHTHVTKAIGFMIYNLRSFSCKSFHCFFHLWGSGAPNWQREFKDWISEQSRDWRIVSHHKSPLTKANAIPVAAGRSYAEVARDQHNDPIYADHMHASRSPSNSNCRPSDRRNDPAPPRPTLLLRSTAAHAESRMGRPLLSMPSPRARSLGLCIQSPLPGLLSLRAH
jgi:hypothetical protein